MDLEYEKHNTTFSSSGKLQFPYPELQDEYFDEPQFPYPELEDEYFDDPDNPKWELQYHLIKEWREWDDRSIKTRSKRLIGVIIPNCMSDNDIDYCRKVLEDNGVCDIIVSTQMSFGDTLRTLKLNCYFILIDKNLNGKFLFRDLVDKYSLDKNWLITSLHKHNFDLTSLSFSNDSFINLENIHESDNIGVHLCSNNLCELASWNYDWNSIADFLFGISTSDLLKNKLATIDCLSEQ